MDSDLNSDFKADILIVDDTLDNIRFLSSLLSEQGYKVRKAINGQMALTAVNKLSPDLILLDINMPDMNGYEVCQELKKNPQSFFIPVIFLSALDDVVDKVKAFRVGGSDYVTKPFQIEEVLSRIENQLTIRKLQAQMQAQNQQLQQALNELQKTQAQLIQKEKMIGLAQLVAGVAHEINNPVGFISSNLAPAREYIQELLDLISLYQREYPNSTIPIQEAIKKIDLNFLISDLQQLMNSMQTGVERINNIVLALRIFSRLNESDIKPVDIHEGIDSVLLLLDRRLQPEEARPVIKVIKDYGSLPMITCYASQLNQVFLNILNNAIDALALGIGKHFPAGTVPTIWIKTQLVGTEKIEIRIKDNGEGIPENIQSRLFDPFFTTRSVGKGSGLGLLTSYQIINEKHRGQLTYCSLPGHGAEFAIAIPIKIQQNS